MRICISIFLLFDPNVESTMHGNDTSNTMFMLRKQAPSNKKLKDRREEGMGYTQPNGHPVNWGPKAGGCAYAIYLLAGAWP